MLSSVCAGLAVGGTALVPAHAAPTIAASSVVELPQALPNYFTTISQAGQSFGKRVGDRSTGLVADPTNHLLFETNPSHQTSGCTDVVSYDIDTLAIRATGCPFEQSGAFGTIASTITPFLAVDPTDRLLFVPVEPNPYADVSPPFAAATIALVSEDTLKVVGNWSLPSGIPGHIGGISWYQPTDQLIVISDYGQPKQTAGEPIPPGLNLTDYSVKASLRKTSGLPALWSVSVPGCAYSMYSFVTIPAAHRSNHQPYAYVPCELTGAPPQQNIAVQAQTGVARIQLTSQGCAVGADACPMTTTGVTGSAGVVSTMTPMPGYGYNEFLFDSDYDRGYNFTQSGSGITLVQYDGVRALLTGRAALGNAQDLDSLVLGLDDATGRLYGAGYGSGVTLVDGRRTPFSPGNEFSQIRGFPVLMTLPVLPPDASYPYTRMLANFAVGDPVGHCASCSLPAFTVLGDAVPVTHDPPGALVDQNTTSGAIPPGSTVAYTYSSNARGYGVHSDSVGSYGGALNNVINGGLPALPFSTNNRDLISGTVFQLQLDNGAAQGSAAAMVDGQSSTAAAFKNCSNVSSIGNCQGVAPLPAVPGAPDTTQPWPYTPANCTAPGAAQGESATSDGAAGSQGQEGDASEAHAHVACAATQSARPTCAALHCIAGRDAVDCHAGSGTALGDAHIQGYSLSSSAQAPGFSVGPSSSQSWVSPPGDNAPIIACAWADSKGININVAGQGGISIGEVSQSAVAAAAGRAGTAHANRTVSLSDVSLTVGATTVVLCHGACTDDQSAIDQINNTFPTLVHMMLPAPDGTFAQTGYGSPGGYTAAIQADPAEQFGDRQFNGFGAAEASFLPALRIVLYDDGSYQLNREILDLAGVEADAELGLSYLPPVDEGAAPPVNATTAALDAGVPSGNDFSSGGGSGSPGSLPVAIPVSGGSIIEKVLSGFRWWLRDPAGVIQALGALALFASPMFLMDRRRIWVRDIFGRIA